MPKLVLLKNDLSVAEEKEKRKRILHEIIQVMRQLKKVPHDQINDCYDNILYMYDKRLHLRFGKTNYYDW